MRIVCVEVCEVMVRRNVLDVVQQVNIVRSSVVAEWSRLVQVVALCAVF